MPNPISSLNSLSKFSAFPAVEAKGEATAGNVNFQTLLMDSLSEVNDLEQTAQINVESRLLGEDITSAEVFTSMRKAELALKMMMQVRNKLVSSFQELQQMRM
ncbi:MAG: flagellar hook-basal body complex protein FliE [Planctomycetaceae bacterium]|nr:flagellar hook-basal body complex protein FliE [Planctomycetaceae bacterium]